MVKPYFSSRTLSVGFAAAVAAALLAGCGGSQALGPAPAGGTSSLVSHSPIVMPDAKGGGGKGHGGCERHGGVSVTPCTVDFTASSTGPYTVVVKSPESKKGMLSELDTCGGASGIATVVQGSGDDWTVTAGLATGSCAATFSYKNKQGKTTGYAVLNITNSI